MRQFFILAIFILLSACKAGPKQSYKEVERDYPELNISKEVTLTVRRENEISASCLYLTQYDKEHNNCSMYLDGDSSVAFIIETSDYGHFQLLETGSNHDISPINYILPLGDRIETSSLKVGGEYVLTKTSHDTKAVISFKLLQYIYDSHIHIEYQVKEYEAF